MPPAQPKDEDLSTRLEAYSGKEYSDIIEFPVELVDRDGVVRRYSYEESLAVYRRRIQSAPWRYAEDALVAAEIGHCSQRIDQLKRSFKILRDGGKLAPVLRPRAALGEGYEILRRFYGKVLQRRGLRLDGDLGLTVTLLQEDPASRIYHITVGEVATSGSGHLLYVYPFDRVGDQDPTELWRKARASYMGHVGAEVELLLLAEEGAGAGYILTGKDPIPPGLRAAAKEPVEFAVHGLGGDLGSVEAALWPMSDPDDDGEESPEGFAEGVLAFREERLDDAVACFQGVLSANPYHRESYLALLGSLDALGRQEEAEFYAEMASHHLPNDGLIHYRKAIHQVRIGQYKEAVQLLDQSSDLEPQLHQPAFFAAHLLLAHLGDLDGAAARLETSAALAEAEETAVHQSLLIVKDALRLRSVLRLIGLLGTAVALVLTPRLGPVLGTALVLTSLATWRLAPLVAQFHAQSRVRLLALDERGGD